MTHATARCISLPRLDTEIYYFPNLTQPFPPHFHDAAMLGCLLKGCREVKYAANRRILKAGDCELVPANVIHACSPVGQEASSWICMHIRRPFPPVAEPLRLHDMKLHLIFKSLSDLENPDLQQLAQSALTYLENLDTGLRTEAGQTSAMKSNGRFERDYAGKITLSELAATESMNKFAYIRAFAGRTGITPYRYLEAMRVTIGQRLLRSGSSLTDCALNSGFYDQSHFSRCFKARLGVTPGMYRSAYPV